MRGFERSTTRRGIVAALVAMSALASVALTSAGQAATLAPPVNTTEPSISGTARVGNVLQGDRGDWLNAQSYALRWMRCDPSGGAPDASDCAPIGNATGNNYRVRAVDSGFRLRFRVTATNADGSTVAASNPTARVPAAEGAPANTARPTITGDPRDGQTLTANDGTWTNTPTSFSYQWQRCDIEAVVCGNVVGATGKTYGVRTADVGFRVRVQVTARNASGTGTAASSPTSIVQPRTPITNRRPTMTIISIRFTGARVYARFRICDDQPRNLRIFAIDSRPGVRSATRRFATRAAPRPCGAYTRSWIPAQRFRAGRHTITLRARDSSGNMSNSARRTFRR